MKGLVILGVFAAVGLLVDSFGLAQSKLFDSSRWPREFGQWLAVAAEVPWTSVLFGLLFPAAVFLTDRAKRRMGWEEVGAFALIVPMITICIRYGGVFLAMVLNRVGIPAHLVIPGIFAFFIGAVSNGGLYLGTGFPGCVILFIATGGAVALAQHGIVPGTVLGYPFTLICVVLALLSLKEKAPV